MEGERLLEALLFFWPEFGRCGGRKIPRSWRCVKGWRRVTPGKARNRTRNAECGGTICPCDATRNTRDFKSLLVGTPSASLHVSKLHATTSWTPSAIAPRLISAARSHEGLVRGPAVFYNTHPYHTHFTGFFHWVFSVFRHTHTYTHAHVHLQSTVYLARGLSKSICVNTRKTVKYA